LFCFLAAAADQDLFAETDGTTKTMVDGQGLAVIFDRREEPRPQRCGGFTKQTNKQTRRVGSALAIHRCFLWAVLTAHSTEWSGHRMCAGCSMSQRWLKRRGG
jgi:hypothetical protein